MLLEVRGQALERPKQGFRCPLSHLLRALQASSGVSDGAPAALGKGSPTPVDISRW
jgi:hypothetical protein